MVIRVGFAYVNLFQFPNNPQKQWVWFPLHLQPAHDPAYLQNINPGKEW